MENRARTWFFIGCLLIVSAIAFGFGLYAYHNHNVSDMNMVNMQKLAEEEKQEDVYNEMNEVVETASTDAIVSPNAIVTEKRYYKACDHLIRENIDVPDELVNQVEETVKEYYFGWKVEKYSPTEIIVYKEFKGMCNEHYVVKEHDGVLGIYIEDEQKVLEWLEDTEIEVQYLPEDDIKEFKIGIKVVGKVNLNSFLEDYE